MSSHSIHPAGISGPRRADGATVRALVDTWRENTALGVASHFSCLEADAFAELMRELGEPDFASLFIDAHAQDDSEGGDLHHDLYTPPDETDD
ncbi:hypothetical protein ACFXMT_35655 [Streptomyces mirabilis]|uniref:hypothetical protein n=1 Tax=Streptomyces mirabilis TaxID=68239 RepID=UPI0036A09695